MPEDPYDPTGGWIPEWAPDRELEVMLLDALDSEDPDVVHEALDGFHESASPVLARKAVEVARRETLPVPVRCEAIQALEPALEATVDPAKGDPAAPFTAADLEEIGSLLRAAVEDPGLPEVVRCQALETAALTPGQWQGETVHRAWKTHDPDWRFAAVVAMGRLPGFEEELGDALGDEDHEIRGEAAVAVGDRRLARYAGRLLELLEDVGEENLVRVAAVEGIGLLGPELTPPRAAAILMALFREGDDDLLAMAAETALMRLGLLEASEDPSDVELEGS